MKKVCFITTVSMTLKAFVLPTVEQMLKSGEYDITLICDYDEEFAEALPAGIRYLPVHMARGISFSVFSAVIKFKKIFKREKFDYIQYSTPNAAFAASVAAAYVQSPVRIYAQWGIRYVGMSGVKRKIFKLLEKIACNKSTSVRSVSRKNMQFGIDEGLYPIEKVSVIGNGGTVGVDLTVFNIADKESFRNQIRKKYQIPENTYVFGFVGRLSRDKGANELLSAFKRLCDKGSDIQLFLVGNNETGKSIDPRLFQWARSSDRVIFTGEIENTALPAFYAAFDCYVHPTYREGFGMVLQEAGAMGNAVITTDIPGAGEVMENGRSCILVTPKNSESLFSAIERLSTDRKLTGFLGDNAYIRTKELYSREVMVEHILEDINNVLGGKQNEPEANACYIRH